MAETLWTSVPAGDVAAVRRLVPRSAVEAAPLSLDVARENSDARIVSVMPQDRMSAAVLDSLPLLEAVVTRSDGHDHLPHDELDRRGIRAYHLEGYATESVAHLALALILMLLRRLPEAHLQTHAGAWDRGPLVGRHLGEVQVGVLGTGRIGGRLAHILSGLGTTVIGYDVAPDPALQGLPGFRYVDDLDALLSASDVLTLHVPLTHQTRGLLDGPRLDRLPPGAQLVNTARAAIVDEQALLAALDSGRVRGYATDVLRDEPNPDMAPWRGRDDVVVTPHLGAHNRETLRRRYALTAEILGVLQAGGEPPAQYRVPAGTGGRPRGPRR